jgi:inner membrane protein
VDPLFSVPVFIGVALASLRRQRGFAVGALAWALCYLSFGVVQNGRAEQAGRELAASRGHSPVRLEAKPGFGSLLLWKIVYEHNGRYYVDAVRTGLEPRIYPGQSRIKLDLARHLPWLDPASVQAQDIERFRWFSDDFLAVDAEDFVIDVRYSLLPNEINPLWGIRLDPAAPPDVHVAFETNRTTSSSQRQALVAMLLGRDLP